MLFRIEYTNNKSMLIYWHVILARLKVRFLMNIRPDTVRVLMRVNNIFRFFFYYYYIHIYLNQHRKMWKCSHRNAKKVLRINFFNSHISFSPINYHTKQVHTKRWKKIVFKQKTDEMLVKLAFNSDRYRRIYTKIADIVWCMWTWTFFIRITQKIHFIKFHAPQLTKQRKKIVEKKWWTTRNQIDLTDAPSQERNWE